MREHITVGPGSSMGADSPVISDAVRFGDLLFLSGRAAVDPVTLEAVGATFEAQAEVVLRDIGEVLEAASRPPRHGTARRPRRSSERRPSGAASMSSSPTPASSSPARTTAPTGCRSASGSARSTST
jgi:hypothetical protein